MNIFYKKSLYLLIISSLSLTSCYQAYLATNSQVGVLNNIPTIPHQNKVEVYFPGEYPEDKEYIKIKVLETVGGNYYNPTGFPVSSDRAGSSLAYPSLIDGIRKQAQAEGMDAVLIIDRAEIVSSISSSSNVETSSSLSAVGIKFKKNLNYLDNFVQRKNVLLADSTEQFAQKSFVSYEYDPGGKIIKSEGDVSRKSQQLYINYIQKYNYDFLVNEKSNEWRYHPDEFGVIRKRIYIPQNMVVKLDYNSQKQVDKVKLSFPTTYDKDKETIYFEFDEQKQVSGFEVEQDSKIVLRGTYSYDENNRLVRQDILKIIAGAERPFLQINNEYFPRDYAYQLDK